VNEANNGGLGNIEFKCADVTTLQLPPASCDTIFINWLLMYLNDDEVSAFAHNALRWLSPGGHLFFRESCRQQSGSAKRTFNPTHYRDPERYDEIFKSAAAPGHKLSLRRQESSQTYIKHKGNPNQIIWLWQKEALADPRSSGPRGSLS